MRRPSRPRRGLRHPAPRADFDALADAAARLPAAERIAFANRAIDQLVDHAAHDAVDADVDRWSTPVETLARGQGDCEDFAIARFFLLRASALPGPAVRPIPQFSFDERCLWDVAGNPSRRGIGGLRIWRDVVARTRLPAD